MDLFENFQIITDNLPFLLKGAKVTIEISLISFVLALFIAFVVGIIRSYDSFGVLKKFLGFYVEAFRGTPLLIQLFFIYYGLPSLGITMDSYTVAITGLALNSGAYMSEIVRGAIKGVDKGQFEAAYSMGYSKLQATWHIVIPQALVVSIPALVNSFSDLLKSSSLITVISITELTRCGQLIYTSTSRPFEVYTVIAIIYFVLIYVASLISKILERKLALKY
ncbi:amino acid ABC transporter membrane protein, PAAT family [Hathewaya proteolytica DSM 3090]|uniref:Amino acid ABC transporter membrane protein, PAAT family n=1 Tax=Hathewaya proteolytica DSM 3090 TaxID=1121331 RepID=A0A1M6KK74_9CLOT|nr:amino acid ABC transporter permease [Hathewaya proteolytica]SHJ59329.1 amino acid ABC transporter membrane protein, PAAT family [Hathewaya proteolytica DSM 3090]